jgi:pimeloyl-ACP methyl ester carboxylesterase
MKQSVARMRGPPGVCWLVIGLALAACSTPIEPQPVAGPVPPYDYTIVDPLAATVVGTPPAQAAHVPDDINRDERRLTVFPDREIPRIFWYADQLQFSLVYQVKPAPLIFLVPGTGAGPNSIKSEYLQKALFQGGYHVISLASPAEPEFVITASSTGIAGRPQDDARDLYRVMQLAYAQVKDRIQVEGFHLLGYSMGAWNAAFVAQLDAQEKVFDFDKVLLINPPVSLYDSAQILDKMLDDNIPGGTGNIGVLLGQLINQFAGLYQQSEALNFSSDYLLYNLYTRLQPSDAELQALIGLAFRFTSANLVFTSDVMTNSGLIVPKNLDLGPASSLTDYFETSIRMTFIDYFDDLYYPYFKEKDPSVTRQELIDEASLEYIRDFLAHAEHVGVMSNEDDIILAPGQIDVLRELFDDRAQIWPTGGHMGNLATRAVTGYVVDYFGR